MRTIKREPLPASAEAVVIGGGVSGLAVATILASLAGLRVVLLERHFQPGGLAQTFKRRHFEWDIGLHYLGDVGRSDSTTRHAFDRLTGGRVAWHPLADVYDRTIIGNEVFDCYSSTGETARALAMSFPSEQRAIETYFGEIEAAASVARAYLAFRSLSNAQRSAGFRVLEQRFDELAAATTHEQLQRIGVSSRLAAVLTSQWANYGLPPGRSSYIAHALTTAHYFGGAAYPAEGSTSLTGHLIAELESVGGRVHVCAEAASIDVAGGAVSGVTLQDGRTIASPLVISSVGARETFTTLLRPGPVPVTEAIDELRPIEPSTGHVCLYVGLSDLPDDVTLPRGNLWILSGWDHDRAVDAFGEDHRNPLPVVMITPGSQKGRTSASEAPTLQLITPVPYRMFQRWRHQPWRKRDPEYYRLKRELQDRLISCMVEHLPISPEACKYAELSTPLSTEYFTRHTAGGGYGLAHTPARFRAACLKPETAVRGLYLTGQDTGMCGIVSAVYSAIATASTILQTDVLGILSGPRQST